MLDVEILIVGGGPAGATAALNLAPTRRVAVIDLRAVPMPRIGESLPPAARRLLTDMGLFDAFRHEGHMPYYGNRSVWGSPTPAEADFLHDPDGHGWHLDRTRFETWLRHIAIGRGAALIAPARIAACEYHGRRWHVTLSTTSTLHADLLIDASGRSATLARRLGARRCLEDRLVCRWAYGRANRGVGLTVVEAVEDGWWYTAPLPAGRRVLAFHSDADLPAARSAALLERAADTIELSQTLAECGFRPDKHSGMTVAHSAVLTPCVGSAWLATGDAALSFDPLSAQGLLNALFTGLAAAEAADNRLSGDAVALPEYAAAIASIYAAYRRHLDFWYRSETRWPDAPFWRRRQTHTA
jgi:flavin-dependent dehydrogenase